MVRGNEADTRFLPDTTIGRSCNNFKLVELNGGLVEMEELKSCPFCGGKAVVHVDGGVSVICTTCESRTTCLRDGIGKGGYMGGAIEKVIEKWNRRV